MRCLLPGQCAGTLYLAAVAPVAAAQEMADANFVNR
jgi:hypothetical protein